MAGVGAPHHVLDLGDLDGGEGAFLLHVEQRDSVRVAQQQRARPRVKDLLAARNLHLLHDLILQVLDQQLVEGWVKIKIMIRNTNRKAITRFVEGRSGGEDAFLLFNIDKAGELPENRFSLNSQPVLLILTNIKTT